MPRNSGQFSRFAKHGPSRFTPFLSHDLEEYLRRYWALVFTVGSRPIETGHMRHYLSWYCTRLKVVELDHHVYAPQLRQQLVERTGVAELPVLFVNAKLVGTLQDVKALEEKKLLKDVVQFGFQWKTGHAAQSAPQALHTMPAAYGDTELFRGRYRGPPVQRPVVQLPSLHPYHNADHHTCVEPNYGHNGNNPVRRYMAAPGSTSRQHPSLALYRGDVKIQVALPTTADGDPTATTTTAGVAAHEPSYMGIIQLHHTLFPPAPVGQLGEIADEHYAEQIASSAGLAVLRVNWSVLLAALFPCMLEGDPIKTAASAPSSPDKGGASCPEGVHEPGTVTARDVPTLVQTHMTTSDYDGFRQPGMMDRMYYSFISFLRFFGWRVHDEQRGVLDRHRQWKERYAALAESYAAGPLLTEEDLRQWAERYPEAPQRAAALRTYCRNVLADMPSSSLPSEAPSLPVTQDCYTLTLLRILFCFSDVGFLTLAVGLVEFLLDEMACDRLGMLYPLVDLALLPCLQACSDIADGHKRRLTKKLVKLTHSDSD